MEKKKIKRIFNASDMEVVMFAKVLLKFLTDRLADFTNFRSTFDAQYVADFDAQITVAFQTSQDIKKRKEIFVQTENVYSAMANCRKQYRKVMFTASEAFEGMAGILNEFGKNTYKHVRTQHEKMFYFMVNLYKVSKKYETELLAKGLSQADLDNSQTMANALKDAVDNQNSSLGDRNSTTTHRIIRMNTLYRSIMSIREAGTLIYEDKPALIKMLRLPWGSKKRKGGEGDIGNGGGDGE